MLFFREIQNKSYIRVLHALPSANQVAVDVYANGNLLAEDVGYADFSEYVQVTPGEYTFSIYPHGNKESLLYSKKIKIDDKKIYTLAIMQKDDGIDIMAIDDIIRPMPKNALLLRFVHLSPVVPMVNVTHPDGSIIFKNVDYSNVTNYTPLRPGIIPFQLRDAKTDQVLLNVPNIRFKPNRYYTIYAVGNSTKEAPVQVLIPLDGNSYLNV